MKNKYGLMKVLIVLLVFVVAGVIYSCSVKKSEADVQDSEIFFETESSSEENASETEMQTHVEMNAKICVHVCGAVAQPGVYYLDEGSRVHMAVELAGGLLENAADEYVNMAREISDGIQIYIPTREEADTGTIPEGIDEEMPEEQLSADDGKVNINTASLSELSTLPGIGESKADAIIAYRENVSEFSQAEDIMNVAGIKESSYEKIKDHIKVN